MLILRTAVLIAAGFAAGCSVQEQDSDNLDTQWDALDDSQREDALRAIVASELEAAESMDDTTPQQAWEVTKARLIDALSQLRTLLWHDRRDEYLELEQRVEAILEAPPTAAG